MIYIRKLLLVLILFLLGTEGLFPSYQIAGNGIVRWIQLVFFLIIIKTFLKDINQNKILYVTLILTITFSLLLSVKLFTTTFIFNEMDMDFLKNLFRLSFMFIYLYIIYYAISNNIKFLNIILLINFPIMLVAFFQSSLTPFTDLAWNIRFNYFFQGLKYEDTPWFRSRVTGLYAYAIPLAYILATNMILTIYLYLKSKSNIYIYYFIFLGIISIFSLTRSIILSWLILFMYLTYKILKEDGLFKKLASFFILIMIIVYAINIYTSNIDKLGRIGNTDGESAEGRVPLALTASYALVKYPFGFSDNEYDRIRVEMYKILHNENILKYAPHNGFLNLGFKYTTFGILAFLLYIIYIINIIKINFSNEMKIFFMIAMLSYLVNALFHNNFIFYQDFYGLMILAIIAYEYKTSRQLNHKGDSI